MTRYLLSVALLVSVFTTRAQNTHTSDVEKQLAEIQDRIAIKNVVDTFSVLADRKDIATQVLLFTEDATVGSRINGQSGMVLKGRKQIGDAFSGFLAGFETVYHINGQQTLTLNGDKATGISYCFVTLIGTVNGTKMKTQMGVYYNDEFVRQGGKWLIAKRVSNFAWQDRQPLGQ